MCLPCTLFQKATEGHAPSEQGLIKKEEDMGSRKIQPRGEAKGIFRMKTKEILKFASEKADPGGLTRMGQGISSWRYLLRNTPMCLNLSHWQDYEDELVTSSEKTQQARKKKGDY